MDLWLIHLKWGLKLEEITDELYLTDDLYLRK
jgi:hypothetical protein